MVVSRAVAMPNGSGVKGNSKKPHFGGGILQIAKIERYPENLPRGDVVVDQEKVWRLFRDGKHYGPYPFPTLVEAVRKRVLLEGDQIWRPGWNSWRAAHSVPGLFVPPELDTPLSHQEQDTAKADPGKLELMANIEKEASGSREDHKQ
jgi:hypothetical protein